MPDHNFDPKRVTMTFGGRIIDGYADGSAIAISFTSDGFDVRIGATGEYSRAVSHDRSGTIVVRLMSGSVGNAILSTAQNVDREANSGGLPCSVIDPTTPDSLGGPRSFATEAAWVRKQADLVLGSGTESLVTEWTLQFGRGQMTHGVAA